MPRPARPGDFPMPMDYSLGPARSAPRSQQASNSQSPQSFGPVRRGAENNTPYGDLDTDAGGPDWRNQLIQWVQRRAYYPPEARSNWEEGTARVNVEATPDGKVRSVELVGRSGSMWLDLALQSIFRDARIPPIPGGTEPIRFTFTMHYILIRR